MIGMLPLIGCSNGTKEIKVQSIEKTVIHPARPIRPKLKDEKFVKCNNEPKHVVCMKRQSAADMLENKIKIGKYMDSSDAVIDYYRELY